MSTTAATPKLADLVCGAQLPALPQSAIRLLELAQDPDNGPPEFAVPIEADPGLAGQVLRFVNSSYFGFSREIASVRLAITLVGVRTIKNFALWSAVFSVIPNPKCGPFDLKSLWQDSLRRGLFARSFGKAVGIKDAEDLFTAALLQDMAVPLLAKELPKDYQELLEERAKGNRRLSELEFERFGWTHADAAAMMAENWHLPNAFRPLLSKHIRLEDLMADSAAETGAKVVAVSSLLPTIKDAAWDERDVFEAAFAAIAKGSNAAAAEIFSQVDASYEEFAPMLKLATPATKLVDYLA